MGTLKTTNIQTITGSGTLTLGTSGETVSFASGVTGLNYPAFEAILSSSQATTDATHTKIQFDTEIFDTDNCYDNTTNYRFTPTVAGKYYVYVKAEIDFAANQQGNQSQARIYKNGSAYSMAVIQATSNAIGRFVTVFNHAIVDFNGTTDYVEGYGYGDDTSGNPSITGNSSNYRSVFGAYRIGT